MLIILKFKVNIMVNPGEWAMLQEMRPMRYLLYICGNCGVLYPGDGSGWFDIRISIILAAGSGHGHLTGNIWREMLKQTIFDISQEKRQPVSRCHNILDRKGQTKEGHLWYLITINKRVIIIKERVNEGWMV